MDRTIQFNHVTGETLDAHVRVSAHDGPGSGGASHRYRVEAVDPDSGFINVLEVRFQEGPIKEVGINGVSDTALLAVLIDRLEGFESGRYACQENEAALLNLQEAMLFMNQRTLNRLDRDVEGRSAV